MPRNRWMNNVRREEQWCETCDEEMQGQGDKMEEVGKHADLAINWIREVVYVQGYLKIMAVN